MTLAERMKFLRKETLKLTQKEWAERLGVSAVSIYYYETGKQTPSPAQYKNIAAVTGVSLEWIMNGTGPMYLTESREEEIMNLVSRLMKDAPEGTKAAAIELILRYPDDEWSKLFDALSTLAGRVNI